MIELGNGYQTSPGQIDHFVKQIVPHFYEQDARTLRMPVYREIDSSGRWDAEPPHLPEQTHIEIRMPDGLKSLESMVKVARLLVEVEIITIAEQLSQ